jgi:hypothetical protein
MTHVTSKAMRTAINPFFTRPFVATDQVFFFFFSFSSHYYFADFFSLFSIGDSVEKTKATSIIGVNNI